MVHIIQLCTREFCLCRINLIVLHQVEFSKNAVSYFRGLKQLKHLLRRAFCAIGNQVGRIEYSFGAEHGLDKLWPRKNKSPGSAQEKYNQEMHAPSPQKYKKTC